MRFFAVFAVAVVAAAVAGCTPQQVLLPPPTLPAPPAPPAPPALAERAMPEAAAAVEAFHSALARGDQPAALALLTEDAIIYEEGAAERSRAEYAAHHLGADAEFSRSVASSLTAQTARGSGDVAWVASERRSTGTFRGKAIDSLLTETMVLIREGGQWRIRHIHWSSAAAR